MIVLIVIAVYLLAGLLFLGIFDLLTGKVRKKFGDAVTDTQLKIADASPVMGRGMATFIGRKTAFVVTVLATWVFWVAVLYGFLESQWKERRKDADNLHR